MEPENGPLEDSFPLHSLQSSGFQAPCGSLRRTCPLHVPRLLRNAAAPESSQRRGTSRNENGGVSGSFRPPERSFRGKREGKEQQNTVHMVHIWSIFSRITPVNYILKGQQNGSPTSKESPRRRRGCGTDSCWKCCGITCAASPRMTQRFDTCHGRLAEKTSTNPRSSHSGPLGVVRKRCLTEPLNFMKSLVGSYQMVSHPDDSGAIVESTRACSKTIPQQLAAHQCLRNSPQQYMQQPPNSKTPVQFCLTRWCS